MINVLIATHAFSATCGDIMQIYKVTHAFVKLLLNYSTK